MTESVLASLDEADGLFRHVPPRPLGRVPLRELEEANARLGLALTDDEIDYLREPTAARPRSHRRRADHVRAGELRALPPQDLQRRLGRRRRTQDQSLFAMIRHTHAANPQGTVVAYSDNAAIIEGAWRSASIRAPTALPMQTEELTHT